MTLLAMLEIPESPLELARQFAPIFHFHPQEGEYCCYPSDAEEIYERFHDDWSKFKRDLTPKKLDPNAPCYYEVFDHGDWRQVRYWVWYRYNRFPGGNRYKGLHLGDWEHIEVRIYPSLEEGIIIWFLSNHLSARLGSLPSGYTINGFESEELILDDYHVHAWVALGSHAHYPRPDSRPYSFARIWHDRIADGGVVWNSINSLRPLSETNFFEYKGRWGDSKAPRSPTNGSNSPWRNAPNVLPVRCE